MESVLGTAVAVALIAGPFAWRVLHDRRQAQSLATRAEIQGAVRGVFGGEPFLTVQVVPPGLGRAGRVLLSVSREDDWLARAAWRAVARKMPPAYELIVRHA